MDVERDGDIDKIRKDGEVVWNLWSVCIYMCVVCILRREIWFGGERWSVEGE